ELALAGQLGVADLDGRAVGVEALEELGGGQGARLVEPLLEGLLAVEQGRTVGDLDLDGEGGLGAGDDRGGEVHLRWVKRLIVHQHPVRIYIVLRSHPLRLMLVLYQGVPPSPCRFQIATSTRP